jgi:hypothetical protein
MLPRENTKATLTIRNLDPAIKERLRVRAARNGRSNKGASVVTRDTGGFEHCGVSLINPWGTS